MKIGILTAFNGSDQSYSLVNVVAVQLRMLIDAGYRPIVFVGPAFAGSGIWADPRIVLRRIAVEQLADTSADVDVMLCHDIVFLKQHEAWGTALRQLARQRGDLALIHWQHSRGDPQVEPCAHSWYAYPNHGDLEHVAWLNQAPLERVRYIPHALDTDYLQWPPLALKIAQDFKFHQVDVAVFLPTRLDRQKQVEKALRVVAGLKHAGRSVCFLVGDAMATGERFLEYKAELKDLARELDLTNRDFAFLGECYDECHTSTPRPDVKALLEMSNLFIQPSNAETCSLVALEASLAGNLLMINADFEPIHHLYEDAVQMPFGSILKETTYWRHFKDSDGVETKTKDPQAFFDDQADALGSVLDAQLTLKVKRQQLRERWPAEVFDRYLEPLILEVYRETHLNALDASSGDPDVMAIITTLDNLPILRRQIPSMLEQCGHVVVVANGSLDGTYEWLMQNYSRHPRVAIVSRDNEGAGKGRNAGLAEWDKRPTAYTLMLDGGIMPPLNGAAVMKDYLERHPEVGVISPEVCVYEDGRSCYVSDEAKALETWPPIADKDCFAQCTLSGTAYALVRAEVWRKSRYSEEGPFGQAGWGCDDNEMQFQWNALGILHHDINLLTGLTLYRRGSGSFARLYRETGIWPSQYGSVYEQRNVKMFQDWRQYYDPIWGKFGEIEYSFLISGLHFPDLAHTIKRLHDEYREHSHEIIVTDADSLNPISQAWLKAFALRWPWGDVTILSDGKHLHRDGSNEAIWTGDILLGNRQPRGKTIIHYADMPALIEVPHEVTA